MKLGTYITRLFVMALALIALGSTLRAQVTSDITLIVTDNGTSRDTLHWGVDPTATNGKDAALGEEEQPPAPPDGVFDARWINVGTSNNFGQGVKKNFHANNAGLRDTFRLKVQPGAGGYPMTITWPNLNSYFGTASLRFVDGDGNPFTQDMKTATSFTFNNPSSNSSTITITTFQPSAPAAGVAATPAPLNFGIVSIPAPGSKTDSITISNTGATNVRIDSIRSTDTHFVVNTPPAFPQTLAPGGSVKVGVTFAANAAGSFTGTVAIYNDQAGSPLNVSVSATASSGEGVYFLTPVNRIMDNRANVYKTYIGLKYSGGTPLQGLQFKVTAPNTTLKLKKVELGPNVANPLDWNFDYEVTNAASGSEVQIILYGRDSTVNLPAATYDSLFRISYDVKDIKVCNDGPSGDSIHTEMFIHDVQSALATNLGESGNVSTDQDRDTASFNVFNSSSRGDVNCDDRVDVLDILETIDVILGRQQFAQWQFNRADLAPWSPTWTPAGVQFFDDANNYGDNQINVQDVVLIANSILNEAWPDGIQLFKAEQGGAESGDVVPNAVPGNSSIFDVKFIYTITRNGIDIQMNNVVPVKGIQMKLKASDAPGNLDVILNGAIEKNFTVQKKVVDGEVRILIYSLSGETFDVSNGLLLQLPYAVTNPNAIGVIEPITVGGSDNQPLKVEYEIRNAAGVGREAAAKAFELGNVPNPFKTNTTINYSLKSAMNVSLVVTDEKGAEVARLVDDARQTAGDHTAEFNASQLPSGTYFYTLTAGGVSMTQRMVVAR